MGIENIDKVWPNWRVERPLGEGSFGKVYKAVREDHGFATEAAIKVVSIPQSASELSSLLSEGMDDDSARTYYLGVATDFVGEIRLLETMKGISNIVSVEDYAVVEKTDGIGFDILIRMELLTPLIEHIKGREVTELDVLALGEDILSALELCERQNVIHRDIKPDNIRQGGKSPIRAGFTNI
jgi:serine/threonine-protein kinase